MSFPSAVQRIDAGDSPDAALLYAMEHDTPQGFSALGALVEALANGVEDPCAFIRERLGSDCADDVLRSEPRGEGVKVDFNPLSLLGQQLARLCGTDAARPLLEQRFDVRLGFANCCGILVSRLSEDVRFTSADQIRWQYSIDC